MNGGVLVGERACPGNGALCEGQCTEPVMSGAPEPTFYWDAQMGSGAPKSWNGLRQIDIESRR